MTKASARAEVTQQIRTLVEPLVRDAQLHLEEVSVSANLGRVLVVVDLPQGVGGIDSDRMGTLTRAISRTLDDADPIEGTYTLEVSTPGAERELTEPRHFSRCIGHLIEFTTNDGANYQGRVKNATESTVSVVTDEGAEAIIDLSTITSARSRVELSAH